MIRNYLKIALRNLNRERSYAAIAVAGLAVSLSACLLIGLYMRYQLSYDRFYPQAEHLYRLVQSNTEGGLSLSPEGIAPALERQFPEIRSITTIQTNDNAVFSRADQYFSVESVFETDAQFFHVFPFEVVAGSVEGALDRPGQAVLTQLLARRLFDEEQAVGQTFVYEENNQTYTVAAVIEDVPSNSHFQPDALLATESTGEAGIQWRRYSEYIYLRLRPDASAEELQAKIRRFEQEATSEALQDRHLTLQPVSRIHLSSDLSAEIAPQSDIRYLYLAGGIGLIILLLACINYANLGAARSMHRLREVGIRKALGADRRQLTGQFLGESLLVVLLALPLAVLLTWWALPWTAHVLGESVPFRFAGDPTFLVAVAGLMMVTGVLAGLYPAWIGSRFDPAEILQGRFGKNRLGRTRVQKGLIIMQFMAAAGLIAAALTIWHQLDLMEDRDLGFDPSRMLVSERPQSLIGNERAFLRELRRRSNIAEATLGPPPGLSGPASQGTYIDDEGGDEWSYRTLFVGDRYLQTVGLELLEGRNFRPEEIHDSSKVVILTQQMAERFGIAGDPIGREIPNITRLAARETSLTVVGVVASYADQSSREPPRPKALTPHYSTMTTNLLVRIRPGQIDQGITQVESVWQQFVPNRPFQYRFLTDELEELYAEERRLARLTLGAAMLAIGLAALGLFGLVAFATERRTREVAVRKVLGATTAGVVGLLSKDFLRYAVAGLLLALPLAYVILQRWLENFAHRISFGLEIILLTAGLVLLIASLTTAGQAVRAALTNPADSLRHE